MSLVREVVNQSIARSIAEGQTNHQATDLEGPYPPAGLITRVLDITREWLNL